MSGVNRVTIVGNLGQDPETRFTQSGAAVTNISVATSESWKDKTTGEKVERSEWHKIIFFNKLAEIAGEYLKKGSKVYVEGQLRTRKWQDKSGQDRYSTEIVAKEMQMLDSRAANGKPAVGYDPESDDPRKTRLKPSEPAGGSPFPDRSINPTPTPMNGLSESPAGGDDWSDDIPF